MDDVVLDNIRLENPQMGDDDSSEHIHFIWKKISRALDAHLSNIQITSAEKLFDRELAEKRPRLQTYCSGKELDQEAIDYFDSCYGGYLKTIDPICLTNPSGTRGPEPTARELVPAVSVPTKLVSSANMVSTSAVNASERRPPILDSSSTVKLLQPLKKLVKLKRKR